MYRKQEAIDEIVRIITNWMGAGTHAIISAQSREAIYDRLFSLMGISNKELRKMLNEAWVRGILRGIFGWRINSPGRNARYRDVSKIIKEARQNQKPHRIVQTFTVTPEEEQP